jgi:sporulation protein YlmC with PRC-barrel domain
MLRSIKSLEGNAIGATDGTVGKLTDFYFDDRSWAIRYLVINTSNWWVGHRVLVSPEWIRDVRWSDSTVTVDLRRQSIKDAPAYDDNALLDRDTEKNLYNHYGRDAYWQDDGIRAKVA